MVDKLIRIQAYFTSHEKMGSNPGQRKVGHVNPASYLFSHTSVCNENRVAILAYVSFLINFIIRQNVGVILAFGSLIRTFASTI